MSALRPGQRVEIVGPSEGGRRSRIGDVDVIRRGPEHGAMLVGLAWYPLASLRVVPQHVTDRNRILVDLAVVELWADL